VNYISKGKKIRKVLILGATGMLGQACHLVFKSDPNFESISTSRINREDMKFFDASTDSIKDLIKEVSPDWVINCIGIIKPHINENNSSSVKNAIVINSLFPYQLASSISNLQTKVLQIATDCVYSGKEGGYIEDSPHDPLDVYGKTKSLGEVTSEQFFHIRASIIGPEYGRSTSLQEWFLSQPKNAEVNGFTDHLWNGLTTHHFALLAKAIVLADGDFSGTQHVIPGDIVTKAQLLESFAQVYNRKDIQINPIVSSFRIDRTLNTQDISCSDNLWKLAGYDKPPTIQEMIEQQYKFNSLHI
jgi:dTDP-4-dehydrorhamnose reductase